jgi:ABC-type uncharacterized transport system involved in gliding motility auxiliary subunit
VFKKVSDQFAYVGSIALMGALFRYTVSGWDWIAQTLVYGGLGLIGVYLIVHLDGIRSALKTRAARYGGTAGATVLLVVGILVLANFLNVRHNRRIDLTENQRYSLSEQSLKVIESLQDEILIIGFFGGDAGRLRFEDLIKQYRSPSMDYQIVDPEEEPGVASRYGISRDGQIVVLRGEDQALVDDLSEEKITNAIIKITREEEKVIYFLQGHGERDIDDDTAEGYSLARQEVENQTYRAQSYNLAQQNRLPEDATVIVSAGPRMDFLATEVALLKEFLEEGGKLLLLVDPQTEFGMGEFLAAYGLALGHKVVIDASGIGQLFGLGAAAPLVSEFGDHPMTQELSGVMTFFPMAQNVTTSSSPLDYRTQGLLTTSPRSWAESQLEEGEAAFDEGQDTQGPLQLAAVATLRVEDLSDSDEETPELESRVVLMGDADFASNGYFDSASNGDLFLMAVGWLSEEADLLAIRPKDPENRRINVTLGQSRMIFWASVVLLPLMTLVLGAAVWMRRK